MADAGGDRRAAPTSNGSILISLPTVLCPPESEDSNSSPPLKIFPSPQTKISLPSGPEMSASPRLSSPSLPSSPLKKSPQPSADKFLSAGLRPSSVQPSKLTPNIVNTGSATGNPRNKCALQPGHSLMDWIRLGNSGTDLTGVGGRVQPVSPRELAAHNTQKDAWLAIRGRVYNITHYLPYHPGGPEELMRGAGVDATELFDKVHPWVNYDSLLAKCLIGPLRFEVPDAEELFGSLNPSPKSDRLREPSKAQELVRKSMENLANCITPVRKKSAGKIDENSRCSPPSKIMQSLIQSSDLPVSISQRAGSVGRTSEKSDDPPPPLRFDWIQTSTKLTLSIYTKPLANPGAWARMIEGSLVIEVATDGWLRTIKVIPEDRLLEQLQLRTFQESGKIEVTAQKAEPAVWASCGTVTVTEGRRLSAPLLVECRVVGATRVSHDTVLIALAPREAALHVPIGHHVSVHLNLDGSECTRPYTPVGEGWSPPDGVSSERVGGALTLAVKRYEGGAVSPRLAELRAGDLLTLSGPYGNFQLQKLKSARTVVLLSAGTGITPMLALLRFLLARSSSKCDQVHLVFFNKTEDDILFRDRFEEISKNDDRFVVTHVLSEAAPSWSGARGRVSRDLLGRTLSPATLRCLSPAASCTHFACVCGPAEFTRTTLAILKQLHMGDACIHAFTG